MPASAGNAIDIHAHYMPAAAIAEMPRSIRPSGHFAAVADLEQRVTWMKANGIGFQLVGPELTCARYDLAPQKGAAWARRVNDLMIETTHIYGQFAVLATVPLQNGEFAASELSRAVRELGCRGAMIHSRGPLGLHQRDLDPFWSMASTLGVPVAIHSGPPLADARLEEFGLKASIGRPHEVTVAACQLIFGGVLDRFPELRPVLLMAGGTLPYLMARLDAAAPGNSGLIRKPSNYLDRFFFDDACYGKEALRFLLNLVGPGRIMVGSDWPIQRHFPDVVPWLKESGVSSQGQHRILAGNAADVFGIA